MPPAQYPTPFKAAFPSEPAGPMYVKLLDLAIEYPGAVVKLFKDGGASIGLSNANGVLRFEFTYDGLTLAEAATLDGHVASAIFEFYGFQFRHPRTGTLYNDVHYEIYEPDHPVPNGMSQQSRHIILIKRPTG